MRKLITLLFTVLIPFALYGANFMFNVGGDYYKFNPIFPATTYSTRHTQDYLAGALNTSKLDKRYKMDLVFMLS